MASIRQKNTATKPAKSKDNSETGAVTGIHVGEIFRQTRDERGQTLDMVADELMIRRFYLEALENGSFKDLPERVYATGFVRNYATYLGLDVNQMVEQFRREAYGTRSGNYQVELSMPEPIAHSIVPSRTAIITACVAIAVLIAGIVFATHEKRNAANPVPAPPAETAAIPTPPVPAPSPAAASINTPAPATTTATPTDVPSPDDVPFAPAPAANTTSPASPATTTNVAAALPAATSKAALPDQAPVAQKGLFLQATQSAWVEIKNASDTILYTDILKPNQLLPLPDEPVTLTTGNAGGLHLVIDGEAQQPLGQVNEVKRNLKLDPSQLRQR